MTDSATDRFTAALVEGMTVDSEENRRRVRGMLSPADRRLVEGITEALAQIINERLQSEIQPVRDAVDALNRELDLLRLRVPPSAKR
jgi:hypothetical protein